MGKKGRKTCPFLFYVFLWYAYDAQTVRIMTQYSFAVCSLLQLLPLKVKVSAVRVDVYFRISRSIVYNCICRQMGFCVTVMFQLYFKTGQTYEKSQYQ